MNERSVSASNLDFLMKLKGVIYFKRYPVSEW